MNLYILPTLALAGGFFALGLRSSSLRPLSSIWRQVAVATLLAVPCTLILVYYTHLLDAAAWYYRFRAAPCSELTAAGLGFGAGLVTARCNARRLTSVACLGAVILMIAAPYAKPVLRPLSTPLMDRWSGGVCLQSTQSTCGPACAATLLRNAGVIATESELARQCYSYAGGTENWYIARALRARGLQADYLITDVQPEGCPSPAIAGVRLGGPTGPGHCITLLGERKGTYEIGDPLTGRRTLTAAQLRTSYYLTGFFLTARKR